MGSDLLLTSIMMADALPSGEILDLIRGQTRLETKLDQFLQTQTSQAADIDTLKRDVAEVKSTLGSYKAYFQGGLALFGLFWTGFSLFGLPYLQRKFGIG